MPAKPLTTMLGQSEFIQDLITQSSRELSSRNHAIKRAIAATLPSARAVMDCNESVATKLQQASEHLCALQQALQVEIRDRAMVDHQLAAAVEQEEGSRHAATHDRLTGLPNRALFRDRLEHGIAQAMRHGWMLAVMFVDLDYFKSINDTFGHEAGDDVLRTVAMRLSHNTRNDDTVSRYGGDEFLCLLTPLQEEADIANIAAKIHKAIQAPCDVRVGDANVKLCLEASIGISVFPKDGVSANALITCADDAMYRAKESRSGVAYAQEEAVPGAVTHRRPVGSRVTSQNAPRILDGEPSAAYSPLSG